MTFAFALISLSLTVAYLAILGALHVLPTGHRPIRDAVSDYAIGSYGSLFRCGLWVSALAVLALAIALCKGVRSPPLATHDVVLLILIPVAKIGMTLFPTDLEGEPHSRTGILHYALAIAAFTFTYLVISDMTSTLRGLDPARWFDTPLKLTASAVAPELALVVITMITPLRRVFGLCERLFLVTTNLWFALVALLLLTRAA